MVWLGLVWFGCLFVCFDSSFLAGLFVCFDVFWGLLFVCFWFCCLIVLTFEWFVCLSFLVWFGFIWFGLGWSVGGWAGGRVGEFVWFGVFGLLCFVLFVCTFFLCVFFVGWDWLGWAWFSLCCCLFILSFVGLMLLFLLVSLVCFLDLLFLLSFEVIYSSVSVLVSCFAWVVGGCCFVLFVVFGLFSSCRLAESTETGPFNRRFRGVETIAPGEWELLC